MRVINVNVGRPRLVVHHGVSYTTAIDKAPQVGPVELAELGLAGDKSADTRHHGGPEQALCVYPHEHYADMAHRLGLADLPVPSFGENLTTVGLLETELCIGDALRIGQSVVVAITKPREPCSKLARKHGTPDVVRWVHETAHTGFYLRVISTGQITPDDPIELVSRPHPGLTIALTMRALFSPDADRDLIERFAACDSLTPGWRERMNKRLGR